MKKICLVGFGPHAKRIHYRYIKEGVSSEKVQFSSLVDLIEKNDDINTFFLTETCLPKNIFLSRDSDQRVPDKLADDVKLFLDQQISQGEINCAIISTEPKAHKIYIEYFISRGIPVLTDKPLTAPVGLVHNQLQAEKIYTDTLQLQALSEANKTPIYVLSQRREHDAYKHIFNLAAQCVAEFGIPITYFDIFHSDGTWSMPGEFYSRENHPYKYGYGKLMHSGYHFVDLAAWVAEVNANIYPNLQITNTTELLSPQMQYEQINGSQNYERFFGKLTNSPQPEGLGEVDSYTTIKMHVPGEDPASTKHISLGRLDLLQSGFSRRAWFDLAADTYKGNGRIRHERITMHLGPLMAIHVHSYQSDQVGKTNIEGVGGEEHLDVYVFRNDQLIGGRGFERLNFGQIIHSRHQSESTYIGQNEISRWKIFQQFITDEKSDALIENQLVTNKLLNSMYISAITKKSHNIKYND